MSPFRRLKIGARLRHPRRRLLLLAALAAAAAVAVPVAWATFTDVPPSNPFYADINAIQAAGITTGCGGGNFCPTANITRMAEAAFIHRGLGRVGSTGTTAGINLTGSYQNLASASITAGGAPGGAGYVIVIGDFTIDALENTLNTNNRIEFRLTEDGNGTSNVDELTLYKNAYTGRPTATGSKTWVFFTPTAQTHTFRLQARVGFGTATVPIIAISRHITVLYVPFPSSGSSALAPQGALGPQGVPSVKPQVPWDKG